MRVGTAEIPDLKLDTIYNIQQKSGSRVEYSLAITENLEEYGKQFSTLPLKFASLVVAEKGGDKDQEFHSDSSTGERVILYLTNVSTESNGPIEFQEYGKVLGNAGTFVHYKANEIHRGCKSDIERYALALAFDDSNATITTVGTSCLNYTCPQGTTLKNPLPPNGTIESDINCCDYPLVGTSCETLTCPSGYVLKNPPPDPPIASTELCCDALESEQTKSSAGIFIALAGSILLVVSMWALLHSRRKKRFTVERLRRMMH